MTPRRLAGIAAIASILIGAGAAGLHAGPSGDVLVASGELEGQFLADSLFHIDEFWMKVPGDTAFNRWLSGGLGRTVVVRLASDVSRFTDETNMRILSGALMHQTVPRPTPNTIDVVGRLPRGDSGLVHMYFVMDIVAGTRTVSPVTFETADLPTVSKFSAYEGKHVNIVIEIR